jgi:hypothetical protein
MNWIEKSIDNLLVRSQGEINSRLEKVEFDIQIDNTKAIAYCHCLHLDGNGNPRVNDLIEFVADKITEYALPKKEIDEARDYLNQTGSPSKINALKRKATALFTDLKKTGEGGEMLLYILIQEVLKIPQLLSKMSLKTSGNVHYHGVDGIHVKYDSTDDSLILYWGESKMYKKIDEAIKNCFESLKGFLLDTFSYNSTQERDLQLITANIQQNINDENLENLLLRYFDKDDNLSNKLKYKGVCFIGFDCDKYPLTPMSKTLPLLKQEINNEIKTWVKTISGQITQHKNLELYEIHVFLIPFPSVEKFREHFLEAINN